MPLDREAPHLFGSTFLLVLDNFASSSQLREPLKLFTKLVALPATSQHCAVQELYLAKRLLVYMQHSQVSLLWGYKVALLLLCGTT